MQINGFVVVRIPKMNVLVPNRDVVPCANGIYYSGVDRNRWADVADEDYFKGKVPESIRRDAAFLKNNDPPSIDLCRDGSIASRLLAYSNRLVSRNELIAVRSPSLAKIKGWVETEVPLEWIGFDVFALGEWSLISQGMFMHPDKYAEWFARINQFGLFDDPSDATPYFQAYQQAASQGLSEPIAPASAGLGVVTVEVGKVLLN